MKKGVVSIKGLLITIAALILYFQSYIYYVTYPNDWVRMADEAVSVGLFLFFLYRSMREEMEETDLWIVLLMGAFAVFGVTSNILNRYQLNFAPIATDMGNSIKVFMVYLGSKSMFSCVSNRVKRDVVQALTFVFRIYVSIAFVFYILNLIFDLGMNGETRYGMRSYSFVIFGAGIFSMMFYAIVFIFTLNYQYCSKNDRKINNLFLGVALFTWATTLRSRAFMYIILYLYVFWILCVKKKQLKLNLASVAVVVAVVGAIGMSQFSHYFGNTETARYILLNYGIKTFVRFFPFGSGFATFGTDAAYSHYSLLYSEYGFEKVWGLSPKHGEMAHDTYWPAIMAEAGLFGTICIIVILYLIFSEVLKKSKGNAYMQCAAVFICITQLFSSIATATFFHYATVTVMFLVPLCMTAEKAKRRKKLYG